MIAVILGTRPEIIKLSPVIREMERSNVDFIIIHTNQHHSENMDRMFFEELKIPKPHYNLNVRSKSHGAMVGEMIIKIEKVLIKTSPDWVIVQGDTNSVLSGAIASAKLKLKIGHVEAGLRSYDRSMPEEINRILTDHVSDVLFCPTHNQARIAMSEGISESKIRVTGNTIVDAVRQNIGLARNIKIDGLVSKSGYFLLTLHRPSNVDNKSTLQSILNTLEQISVKLGILIVFPIHPRTSKNLRVFNIKIDSNKIKAIKPVGYLKMLNMIKNAEVVLTDSGGIQEEACILKTPCVTIRDSTERPETVEVGSNYLAGNKQDGILKGIAKMMKHKRIWKNPYGDGKASRRIVKFLAS